MSEVFPPVGYPCPPGPSLEIGWNSSDFPPLGFDPFLSPLSLYIPLSDVSASTTYTPPPSYSIQNT